MVVGIIVELIIGASGMLGTELSKVYPDAIKLNHGEMDIADQESVLREITRIKPDLVLNTAAYTDVDGCEDNPEMAKAVNGVGPGNIACACERIKAIFVHFSTDYVFDGSKTDYKEDDSASPINTYGHSKLIGESNVSKYCHDYRIIRTSWLFGGSHRNFVRTMMELSSRMDEVKVVSDQYGKPTYAKDLAERVPAAVGMPAGIYHVTNEGRCSWYDFARHIADNIVPCTTKDFPRKAPRPRSSALNNTKLPPMRNWEEALQEYLEDIRT